MVMLQQMIVMFLMMAVGYLCYKKQILTDEVSKKVSAIVVNVANPCMILSSALTDQQMQGRELLQTLDVCLLDCCGTASSKGFAYKEGEPWSLCGDDGFCKHWIYGISGIGSDIW